MTDRELGVVPLQSDAFAPFGQVIESPDEEGGQMNAASFARYDRLANLQATDSCGMTLSIVRCLQPAALPLQVPMMERHPLGSQAFVPLAHCRFIVVVAAPGDAPDESGIVAFATNGRQGINYSPGVWHMPLTAFESDAEFLLIERLPPAVPGGAGNCDFANLARPLRVSYQWE